MLAAVLITNHAWCHACGVDTAGQSQGLLQVMVHNGLQSVKIDMSMEKQKNSSIDKNHHTRQGYEQRECPVAAGLGQVQFAQRGPGADIASGIKDMAIAA